MKPAPIIAVVLVVLLFHLESPPLPASGVDYAGQIKPLLEKHCYACHGALQQKGGLRVDTAESLKRGGESGKVVIAGDPAASRLIEVVMRTGDLQMPPEGEGAPLSADEIELLRQWIKSGASGAADELPQADPREWWSYQLPRRAPLPAVKHSERVLMPIDAFLVARHEALNLTPAPLADRATWLRRVSLDLTGLPPTRAELHRFLADTSPDANEKVVDDLLERPQYGERWGRHWMDVWRYSDWYGSRSINEIRYSQRHIWRWRDWIIDSLNADKPYDRMIVEMLAADEISPTDPRDLAATGFIGRNWYKFDRNVWMFDVVEHTSQAFLGLTLKCARCHDHKYDPITHEEYYRFRAFFEPHDVRTDRLDATVAMDKDATLGAIPNDGVARVFDRQLEVKTYLFQRGDHRYPDESRPLAAGVPAALGGDQLAITPVSLPVEAYYPSLKPKITDGLIEQARSTAKQREAEIAAAKNKVAEAEQILAAAEAAERAKPPAAGPQAVFFRDDFSQPRTADWQTLSGDWVYENNRLVEKAVASFATLVSRQSHPRDFTARLRYRPLMPAGLRSVGFSFDYIDQGNSQDVYTHTGDSSQSVQAFHRAGGRHDYPTAGIVKTADLKVGDEAIIELIVRGQSLSIRLNGTKRLDYVMPVPRRDGKFALWVHNGSAEFLELEIREFAPDRESLRRDVVTAQNAVALAELKLATARAQVESVRLRIAAERVKYRASGPGTGDAAELREAELTASRAEKFAALCLAMETLLQAQHQAVTSPPRGGPADATSPENSVSPALVAAAMKVTTAEKAVESARAAFERPDGRYTPVGEVYPSSSTGRRTALARWIASRQNPRTARVAVNQIWLRHFGQPLVTSVANFGLNGDRPTHPELLDWLAVEFMENGWRMKPIHRMLVLSHTYRMSSALAAQGPRQQQIEANNAIDPANLQLWRMNSRRMEAEVVRDSLLFAAGSLDLSPGGAEISEGQGHTELRRSLYFRNTPNEKMKFLELFDAPDPNACYRRRESVVPQQALALLNSALALDQSRQLAERLSSHVGEANDEATCSAFVTVAFETILSRVPTDAELQASLRFLRMNQSLAKPQSLTFPAGGQSLRGPSAVPHQRARENLVQVLFSHNSFVTVH